MAGISESGSRPYEKIVTVEEGKVAGFDVVLMPRFNLLVPDNEKKLLFKEGGPLPFKWEKPAMADNCIYNLNIRYPNSTNPAPKGLKGVTIVRNVTGLSAEIPVSEFREKGEYVWHVDVLDGKGSYNM